MPIPPIAFFHRVSGAPVRHAQSQLFAWEAGAKGLDVHALAEPTKLEALKREYVTKKTELKDEAKSKIFDKYGGESHLKAPPRELIFSQTEDYVEYSRTGKWRKMIFLKIRQIVASVISQFHKFFDPKCLNWI